MIGCLYRCLIAKSSTTVVSEDINGGFLARKINIINIRSTFVSTCGFCGGVGYDSREVLRLSIRHMFRPKRSKGGATAHQAYWLINN